MTFLPLGLRGISVFSSTGEANWREAVLEMARRDAADERGVGVVILWDARASWRRNRAEAIVEVVVGLNVVGCKRIVPIRR